MISRRSFFGGIIKAPIKVGLALSAPSLPKDKKTIRMGLPPIKWGKLYNDPNDIINEIPFKEVNDDTV